jgi:uncharacterized membrane protein (Fun14 family)
VLPDQIFVKLVVNVVRKRIPVCFEKEVIQLVVGVCGIILLFLFLLALVGKIEHVDEDSLRAKNKTSIDLALECRLSVSGTIVPISCA